MNHLGSHRRTEYDREVVRIVVVAVALALLPAAQPRTTLHVFSPWAGSIPARGVTIDRHLRGACTHGSEVLTRADAWHCHVGRKAYDPCFSNSRGQAGAHVLCLNSPWEDAIAIELIKPLPFGLANPAGVPTRFPPWAMVLASRQECVLERGSLGRIAGLRINYVCAGSGVLLDLPRRGTTWTQAYAATITAKRYTRVAFRQVWW